jgi:hypothetical protein
VQLLGMNIYLIKAIKTFILYTLKKWDGVCVCWGGDYSGLLYGQVVGSCEHSNEPSYAVVYREFLD